MCLNEQDARLDFVEKLATGINKMRYWMKEYGLEIPKIETDGFFTIRFNRPTTKIKEEMSEKNVGKVSVKKSEKK